MPHKKPFLRSNMWDWDRLDAEENYNLVKGWEVGNKVGEDSWYSRYQFGVYEANPTNSDNAKARTKAEKPVNGDLVLDFKLILPNCSIVPNIHDEEKAQTKSNRNPCSLVELDKTS